MQLTEPQRRMEEDDVLPSMKRFSYRAINRIKPFKRVDRSAGYITDLQVDIVAIDSKPD